MAVGMQGMVTSAANSEATGRGCVNAAYVHRKRLKSVFALLKCNLTLTIKRV